jgi:hypothetical protein
MGHTLTIRLTREQAEWLAEASARSGVPQGKLVRDQIDRLRERGTSRSFLRLAGCVRGPKDLSSRKGFSRG